jgi:hypothetical protein
MSNNFIKFMAKVCPLVSIASKRPRVMNFGYQLTLKKLITNAKISCPPFDIHKWKLATTKWQSIQVGKTYNLFFPSKPGSNSWEKKIWTQMHFVNYKRIQFLIIRSPKSSNNYFFSWKVHLQRKNWTWNC